MVQEKEEQLKQVSAKLKDELNRLRSLQSVGAEALVEHLMGRFNEKDLANFIIEKGTETLNMHFNSAANKDPFSTMAHLFRDVINKCSRKCEMITFDTTKRTLEAVSDSVSRGYSALALNLEALSILSGLSPDKLSRIPLKDNPVTLAQVLSAYDHSLTEIKTCLREICGIKGVKFQIYTDEYNLTLALLKGLEVINLRYHCDPENVHLPVDSLLPQPYIPEEPK